MITAIKLLLAIAVAAPISFWLKTPFYVSLALGAAAYLLVEAAMD